MTALEPGCLLSSEPPTSPGCLATGSVLPFCSSPHRDPGIPLATPWGHPRSGVQHLLPCSSILSAGCRGIPSAGPGCPAAPAPPGTLSWALDSSAGLNAVAPEGRGLLRSLIPANFSEL